MKKIAILALGLFLLSSVVFAFDMSVGAGIIYGWVNDTWENYGSQGEKRELSFNRNQYGAFAFFGTRYTEFNFAMRLSYNDWERTWKEGEYAGIHEKMDKDRLLVLSVGAYLKYPFPLGEHFVLFPTVGIDFDATENWTFLWFRGGAGMDVYFTERFFLRGQALYGYGINPPIINENKGADIKPGHAPLFKLGLGWMF